MIIKRFLFPGLALLLFAMLLPSCAKKDDGPESFFEAVMNDTQTIRSYLRAKNRDSGIVIHPSGVVYKVLEPGNGIDTIRLTQTPTVIFKRMILGDDRIVESSQNLPTQFDGRKLKDHILGWQIGLRLITKGGHILLYIPSNLAFGKTGIPGTIPPNAILVCDVKLVDFK